MKHHFKWIALPLVVLSVGLVACEEPYHQKDEQYYFISANINIPYWQEAQEKMIAGLGEGVWQELRSSLRVLMDVAREADEQKPGASGAAGGA